MADVWFTKDTTSTVTTAEAAATPSLHDLLAAPATDLLPGHTTDAAVTGGHATVAAVSHDAAAHALHGLTNNRLFEEEQNRANPLI